MILFPFSFKAFKKWDYSQVMNEPPKLLYICQSIVNFDKSYNDTTPIIDLAEKARNKLFYASYPLTDNLSKKDFEIDIINHFLHRRINFETVTGFKIALINRLRDIMPLYNQMFDIMERNLFEDETGKSFTEKIDDDVSATGSKLTENTDVQNTDKTGNERNTGTQKNEGSGNERNTGTQNTHGTQNTDTIQDLRHSDTPQNLLSDVRSGDYVSDYNYNTGDEDVENNTLRTDNLRSDTESETLRTDNLRKDYSENIAFTDNFSGEENTTDNSERDIFKEHIEKYSGQTDLIDKLLKLQQEKQSIMTMIYSDLEELFLQVEYY